MRVMYAAGFRLGKFVASLLRQRPASLKLSPAEYSRWLVRQRLDVRGHPVVVAADPGGHEVALDYAARNAQEVPLAWARALGVEIDGPQFDGLLLSNRLRARTPLVALGADGSAVVVTPKATVSKIGRNGEWRRGQHIPLDEYSKLRRVDLATEHAIIADSQSALWHPRLQTEAERVGPHTRVLATGLGRTIVFDENGARSHVGSKWVPGIQFTPDVLASMRAIDDPTEQKRHLRFVDTCDQLASALVSGLNVHVMERHGGIYEDNLPGFPRDGYTDAQIAESKRQAGELLARIAAK